MTDRLVEGSVQGWVGRNEQHDATLWRQKLTHVLQSGYVILDVFEHVDRNDAIDGDPDLTRIEYVEVLDVDIG